MAKIIDFVEAAARLRGIAAMPDPVPGPHTSDRRGVAYDSSRDLSLAELAARMREDIRTAIAAGLLPAGIGISVRMRQGKAIDFIVRALPVGFKIYDPDYLRWESTHQCEDWVPYLGDRFSAEWLEVKEVLEAVRAAYNRCFTDSSLNFFAMRFFGEITLERALQRYVREEELTAVRTTFARSPDIVVH